jgi:hypothetical protein
MKVDDYEENLRKYKIKIKQGLLVRSKLVNKMDSSITPPPPRSVSPEMPKKSSLITR